MPRALLLSVRFHDGRYHGHPEWPPSPARFFQALIAGAAQGGTLRQEDRNALAWLEQLEPPVIVAPAMRVGKTFRSYVPNNDLDAVDGDPNRIAEIRTPKLIRPSLFDARVTLLYVWEFREGEEHAVAICKIADGVYQLGRGVDMAWAWGEVIDCAQLEARFLEHGGVLFRPCKGGEGQSLLCPQDGSLRSVEVRFAATNKRFSTVGSGRQVKRLFSQAPKAQFAAVAYNSPMKLFLFELRQRSVESSFAPWPLVQVSKLVENLRDHATGRLKQALPDQAAIIDRVLIGRDSAEADKASRIRIIPLPSIGSPHVLQTIRRVLVEIPPNCPLQPNDVAWAFSGIDLIDPETGEIKGTLVRSDEIDMLRHYGVGSGDHRVWRTVTPVALPADVARRRIDPRPLRQELAAGRNKTVFGFKEAKASRERLREESFAAAAVMQSLRHVGISARAELIRVQREPFEGRGARVEAFAQGTRFAKERLWHVEIAFTGPMQGPLVIGDGRYLGLGVMAPVRRAWRDTFVFIVSPQANISRAEGPTLVRAARRALMALSRDVAGETLRLFSGHERDGGPAASGSHEHVFLAADDSDGDGRIDRLVVAAPWVCDRAAQGKQEMRKTFDDVVSQLKTLRAGRLGLIELGPSVPFLDRDPLIGPACLWESRTPYRATRHAGRRKDPSAILKADVATECRRRCLPEPDIEILEFSTVPNGGGLLARARLRFARAVAGPLLLGCDSHRGGGLFGACS